MIPVDQIINRYKKIFNLSESRNIFRKLFSKSESHSYLCLLCRNVIKSGKSSTFHNKKCMKLHLIWFARYEVLSKVNASKLLGGNNLEFYKYQLLKLDAIIEKEDSKWKAMFNKSLTESLDPKMDNFEFIKPLTKGGYGQIFLTKDKLTGNEMITKIVSISEAIQRSCIASYVNERQMLLKCKSDHIVSIFYSFISEFFIYQIMEYAPNGDLSSNLEIAGRFPENIVRNILVQLMLALKELKKNNIIHGDIKLENVLYSAKEGLVKLADFGLAVDLNTPNTSALGTPEYMAPELILESRKGFESDIWSVGICAYEMLYGVPPFYDETAEKILLKIVNREEPIDFGTLNISKSVKDLITKLLNFDYNNRITLEEVLKHEFFASINWYNPSKIVLPELNSIFEERNKRYKSLQFYNKNTINTEVVTYEEGIINQKTSIENQTDLLKLFPIKNLNKLQN